jgi:hypothetical protein
MKRVFFGVLPFLASSLLALGVLQVAFGTNFGSTPRGGSPLNAVSLADDRTHYVYDDFLYYTWVSDFRWARDYIYGATDLDTYTGSWSLADVKVWSGDYGMNNAFGWVDCNESYATTSGWHPNLTCYGQDLYINLYSGYSYGYDSQSERIAQFCHELGHTVGLRHTSDYTSCMNTGNISSGYLGSHDISHLNAAY